MNFGLVGLSKIEYIFFQKKKVDVDVCTAVKIYIILGIDHCIDHCVEMCPSPPGF